MGRLSVKVRIVAETTFRFERYASYLVTETGLPFGPMAGLKRQRRTVSMAFLSKSARLLLTTAISEARPQFGRGDIDHR